MSRTLFAAIALTLAALAGPLNTPAGSAPELLLPDMTTLESYLLQHRVRRSRGRTLLVFPTAIYNAGRGALEMRGSRETKREEMDATQVIYDAEGGSHSFSIGGWEYHAPHKHWHVLAVAQYRLRNAAGALVGTTPKVSYFLEDTRRIDRTLPGTPLSKVYRWSSKFRSKNLKALTTGISVGWADVYDTSVPGQEIDITGLPAGNYMLEVEVNPDRTLMESDFSNNIVGVPVRLF